MTVRGAPNISNLHRWLKDDPAFADEIAWANRMRDDRLMDEALEISRQATAASAAADSARFAEIRQRLGRLNGGRRRA